MASSISAAPASSLIKALLLTTGELSRSMQRIGSRPAATGYKGPSIASVSPLKLSTKLEEWYSVLAAIESMALIPSGNEEELTGVDIDKVIWTNGPIYDSHYLTCMKTFAKYVQENSPRLATHHDILRSSDTAPSDNSSWAQSLESRSSDDNADSTSDESASEDAQDRKVCKRLGKRRQLHIDIDDDDDGDDDDDYDPNLL